MIEQTETVLLDTPSRLQEEKWLLAVTNLIVDIFVFVIMQHFFVFSQFTAGYWTARIAAKK